MLLVTVSPGATVTFVADAEMAGGGGALTVTGIVCVVVTPPGPVPVTTMLYVPGVTELLLVKVIVDDAPVPVNVVGARFTLRPGERR